MKLIRRTVLVYREGSSDKIYEIDLCEVGPTAYVVNFRYGRRGSRLKEGVSRPLRPCLAVRRPKYSRI